MFRHVVLFRFTDQATEAQRTEARAALDRFAGQIAHLGRLSVGVDAGLGPDNHHLAVVVDFPGRSEYLAYRDHPAHQELVRRWIAPILAHRAAVQYELPAAPGAGPAGPPR